MPAAAYALGAVRRGRGTRYTGFNDGSLDAAPAICRSGSAPGAATTTGPANSRSSIQTAVIKASVARSATPPDRTTRVSRRGHILLPMSESLGRGQFAAPPRTIGTPLAALMLLGSQKSQIGWLVLVLGSFMFWLFVWHADVSAWRF